MRDFFDKFNEKIEIFMQGRYGVDELSTFLLALGMILLLVSLFAPLTLLLISLILIILSYVRTFSRNIYRRNNEREAYLRARNNVNGKLSIAKRRFRERKTYKYFKCNLCRTHLRVPRGRGKIEITCPKCKNRMRKKS